MSNRRDDQPDFDLMLRLLEFCLVVQDDFSPVTASVVHHKFGRAICEQAVAAGYLEPFEFGGSGLRYRMTSKDVDVESCDDCVVYAAYGTIDGD